MEEKNYPPTCIASQTIYTQNPLIIKYIIYCNDDDHDDDDDDDDDNNTIL